MPISRFTEDRLGLVVVPCRYFACFAVGDAPAGQSSCGLFHIVFRVMADTQAEQFQQLAREVFIGVSLAIRRRIKPDQESGVADCGFQQVTERCLRQSAEHLILTPHGRGVADLLVARGEVVVPHEREPFAQRIGREE